MDKASGADIYITTKCAFRCKHCFMGDELNAGNEMSRDEVFQIASALEQGGVKRITLLGGEPFQHSDVIGMLTDMSSLDLSTRVVTNGYRQAAKIVESGQVPTTVDICFSVDGGPSQHDAIRRSGSFSWLVTALRAAKGLGHAVSVIVSLSRDNAADLESVLRFCESEHVDEVTVHHVTARGFAAQSSVLDSSEWSVVLDRVGRFHSTGGMTIRCEDPFYQIEPDAAQNCAVRDSSNLMFFPDGRVFNCLLFIDSIGGHGSRWNGAGMEQIVPAQGEVSACNSAGPLLSCPAASWLRPELYPGSGSRRFRCIYDKVTFGAPDVGVG